jgi:hypothetical protein
MLLEAEGAWLRIGTARSKASSPPMSCWIVGEGSCIFCERTVLVLDDGGRGLLSAMVNKEGVGKTVGGAMITFSASPSDQGPMKAPAPARGQERIL